MPTTLPRPTLEVEPCFLLSSPFAHGALPDIMGTPTPQDKLGVALPEVMGTTPHLTGQA